jgi:hypothetical protein
MSVTWVETHESRKRKESLTGDESADLQYVGFGATDDYEMASALLAVIPSDFRGVPFREYDLAPLGGDCWEATCYYSTKEKREAPDTGEIRFSFDTTGGTVKVTQSLATTSYAANGDTAPDFKGAIGVGKNGDVNGIDVPAPALSFSYTYRMPLASLTLAYVQTLKSMTGKVNNAPWRNFAAGELLFLGARGEEGTSTDPTVTFEFAASENATDIPVGDITVAEKYGHQYLDVYYKEEDDAAANELAPRPRAAYVHTVFYTADFNSLGIGG